MTSVEPEKHDVSENCLKENFLFNSNYWEENNFSLQRVLYVNISAAVIVNQQNGFGVPHIIFMNLSYKPCCHCVLTFEAAGSTEHYYCWLLPDKFIDEVEPG